MTHNPNCDGSHCHTAQGEVRRYPLGGGANLILCSACFAHENGYRRGRAVETRDPSAWPQVPWDSATAYPEREVER